MTQRATLQTVTCVVLALPGLWLIAGVIQEIGAPGSQFGADPPEAVTDYLGEWAMRMLLLALCVSPVRRLTGLSQLAPLRRTAGLFAFGYVVAHLLGYLGLLATFDLAQIAEDFTQRTYIIAGLSALAMLTPLAITSTRAWQRRLGRRWLSLHRLVFAAALAALLHLFWLTKDGYAEPLLYAGVFALALTERLVNRLQRRQPVPQARSL
ncbi:MAG: sulfite oxidase heme-binding subunit YedZ [Pseudomonadales bacterium]